ncbi:aldo/keto reductase [Mumia zhuanghuii]|uniref:Aldo/keto reductase family oxidoreductase n=2 Tax=Mumia TaxID=1546255 RepID=A0ABW1QJE9_9ACTN|nr:MULTISPECIES: aldo/keto reductase [Mumia]KAA1424679.1 aldo/keto reductase [Mumia zhuanghuii]
MRLAYGCMGLGSAEPTPTTDEVDRAEAAVQAAYDVGIRLFDHADIYGGGTAETVFGMVLARNPGLRDEIEIQTKCGIVIGGAEGGNAYDLSREHILASVDASLERLGVERVDRLLLHRPDPLARPGEIADAFELLTAAGKVSAFGVSNMAAAQVAHLRSAVRQPLDVNQVELGLHHRDLIEAGVLVNHADSSAYAPVVGTLEYCADHAITVQAYGPLAQGRYAGRPRGPEDEATAALVQRYADALGATREAVVLGWLLKHPAQVVAVIGTTDPGRIQACADAEQVAEAMTRDQWWSLWTAARGKPLP